MLGEVLEGEGLVGGGFGRGVTCWGRFLEGQDVLGEVLGGAGRVAWGRFSEQTVHE